MKNYTQKQKAAGELATRHLSDKAFKFYSGADPLSVYEIETENGKSYDITGVIERDGLTYEELQEIFEEMQDDAEALDD